MKRIRDMVFVRTCEGKIVNLSNQECEIVARADHQRVYVSVMLDDGQHEFMLDKRDVVGV